MANKLKTDLPAKILELALERGRLTLDEAAAFGGVSRRTAQRYFNAAINLGGLYRSAKHGAFLSERAYRVWCAEKNKAHQAASEKAEEPEFMRPYNPARNVICTECRNSPAMRHVLAMYGAAQ
ncbi:DUF977 family protein [Leclercia adecarboxylata]|uniref:DUF977 family protein n=1 Tax=Leclercia adecarboxylata TaxID=83655 RepID=UPI002DB6DB5D|nr:DUF977 family protein [Leclercia adecarboxylata]MEB5748685.1 DUF977 family protein [Leclercia adecarboxylata]